MIDFITDINEDLEKTQHLPVLTADVQFDEALQRERTGRTQRKRSLSSRRMLWTQGALKRALTSAAASSTKPSHSSTDTALEGDENDRIHIGNRRTKTLRPAGLPAGRRK